MRRREGLRESEAVRWEGRGGPGRVRSQREVGRVNVNHQAPVRKRTMRRGREVDVVILLRTRSVQMEIIWTRTAAA